MYFSTFFCFIIFRRNYHLDQFVDVDERVHGFALVRGLDGSGRWRVPLALAPCGREVHLAGGDAGAQQEHGQEQQGTHVFGRLEIGHETRENIIRPWGIKN